MSLETRPPHVILPHEDYAQLLSRISDLEKENSGLKALLRIYEDWTNPKPEKLLNVQKK